MAESDIWQVIGSIATIATFLIYIFLEWSKIRDKMKENSQFKNALLRASVGSVVFAIAGGLASAAVFWLCHKFLFPLLNVASNVTPENAIEALKNYSGLNATLWAIIGAVFGLVFGVNEMPLSSNWQERGVGAFLGMLGGAFFCQHRCGSFYFSFS